MTPELAAPTKRTRHVWLVIGRDGVALSTNVSGPMAFFTREDAKVWAYNYRSAASWLRVVKVLVPQEPA